MSYNSVGAVAPTDATSPPMHCPGERSEPIRVAVRVRPFSDQEWKIGVARSASAISMAGQTVTLHSKEGSRQFVVDKTFDSHDPQSSGCASQEDVFRDMGVPMLQSMVSGHNTSLLAYGDTGSGKSYSLLGPRHQPGIMPRLMEGLLKEKTTMSGSGDDLRIWFGALEISCDHVLDLMSVDKGLDRGDDLNVMEHPSLGVHFVGAVEALCADVPTFRRLLDFILVKRAMSSTNVNASSSRSSVIVTVRLDMHGRRGMQAKGCFVDLAGSEHQNAPLGGTSDRRLVNRALVPLSLLVRELVAHQASGKVVPFHISKLTLAVKDALIGNCKTCLLATVGPSSEATAETAATLDFAESMRQLRTTPKPQGSRGDTLATLQEEAYRVKAQCSSGPGEPLSELHLRQQLVDEMRRPLSQQMEDNQKLASERKKALEAFGLKVMDIGEAFAVEQVTPYLLNMSDDPVLSGCLMYILERGKLTSIGSAAAGTIVVRGVGVLPHMCGIMNHDNQRVSLERGEEAIQHVLLNGKVVRSLELQDLSHRDRILLGHALLFQLHVPLQAQVHVETIDEGEEHTGLRPLLPKQELLVCNALRVMLPTPERLDSLAQFQIHMEQSASFRELQLYVEDIYNKLDAERRNPFFQTLQQACHLVDEANDITREVRFEDHLHIEVEFVWDIMRETEELLMVRVMQDDCTLVLHYWTYSKFKERLDMMRDVYRAFQHTGKWPGADDPADDPWAEISTFELIQRISNNALYEQRRTQMSALLWPTRAERYSSTTRGRGGATRAESKIESSPNTASAAISDSGSAEFSLSRARSPRSAAKQAPCKTNRQPASKARGRGAAVSQSRVTDSASIMSTDENCAKSLSVGIQVGSGICSSPDTSLASSPESPVRAVPSTTSLPSPSSVSTACSEVDRMKEHNMVLQQQLKEKNDFVKSMQDQMQRMWSMVFPQGDTTPRENGSHTPVHVGGTVSPATPSSSEAARRSWAVSLDDGPNSEEERPHGVRRRSQQLNFNHTHAVVSHEVQQVQAPVRQRQGSSTENVGSPALHTRSLPADAGSFSHSARWTSVGPLFKVHSPITTYK